MYKSKCLGLYCNGVPGGDLFESVFPLPTNIENETRGEELLYAARFVTPWQAAMPGSILEQCIDFRRIPEEILEHGWKNP